MAIPQIYQYDFFSDWRSITNLIATQIGDIDLINLAESDRDSVVESINKVISNEGTLASLTTISKTSLVSSINEVNASVGNKTTLKTTAKTSLVSSINEVVDSLLIGSITFSIGTETDDVIRISGQLKDKEGNNLAIPVGIQIYLSDNSNGLSLAAAAPSGGWAIGTTGIILPLIANKSATVVASATGNFDLDITEAGAKSFYLVVIMPLGNLVISSAITFS